MLVDEEDSALLLEVVGQLDKLNGIRPFRWHVVKALLATRAICELLASTE